MIYLNFLICRFILVILVSILFQQILYAQYFSRIINAGPIVTDSVLSAGSSWNDFNNDGLLDMFTSEAPVHLYKNNGDGTFSATIGTVTSNPFNTPFGTVMASWADYNNDGFQDLFRANFALFNSSNVPITPLPDYLLKNLGPPDYNFELISTAIDTIFSINSTWIDYDIDGDVDLFIFGGQGDNNLFYRNNGNDIFTKIEGLPFLNSVSDGGNDTWVDYDNDGDIDLYLVNHLVPNQLFKSLLVETGNPNSFEKIENTVLSSEGSVFDITASWGDYNNDGYFDAHLAVVAGTDRLFLNNGDGTFTNVIASPVVSQNINTSFGSWGDFDNDGDLDLVTTHVSSGSGPGSSDLFRNDGNGNFTQLTSSSAGDIVGKVPSSQAGCWGDYDNDGDLDFYTVNFGLPSVIMGIPQPNYLYRNNKGNNNNWIILKCEGVISNRSAIGAVIKIKASINGNDVLQKRFISGGVSGHTAQTDLRAHFGLANASSIDSLIIEWPSGIKQVLTNISVNQIMQITEDVPVGFIRADFTAEPRDTINSDSLTVHFEDISFSVTGFPITNWQWDFNGDGVTDSNLPDPSWTYTEAGSYSVTLIVSNGTQADTLTRENFILVTGLVPIIEVNISQVNFGSVDVNTAKIDTSFYIKNSGGASDSIYITIDPGNINPPSALSVSPESFQIAPNDSQVVIVTIYPSQIAGGVFLSATVIMDSRFGYGQTHFEKTFRLRLTGTLSSDENDEGILKEFNLYHNFPNPFNPSTEIKYDLPKDSHVNLNLFDILGNEVSVLVNEYKKAGRYYFKFNAEKLSSGKTGLSSGIYILNFKAAPVDEQAEDFIKSIKMVFLK